MIQPDDEVSLLRMLKADRLPSDVRQECELRTRWFHADGNSGRLGTLAMIDILRHLGYSPPAAPAPIVPAVALLPVGSPVEANFFGGWQPGTMLGLGPGGTIVVRLDSDNSVKECHAHVVRVADVASVTAPLPEEKPAKATKPAEYREPPAEVLPAAQEIDWGNVEAGAEVWINDGDDVKDGRLVAYHGEFMTCHVDGEDSARDFLTENVTLGA